MMSWDIHCIATSMYSVYNVFTVSMISILNSKTMYDCRCRLVDGTNVVQEVCAKPSSTVMTGDDEPPCATDQPAPGHVGSILDITSCMASQCFLVSASCDGIIKVWK